MRNIGEGRIMTPEEVRKSAEKAQERGEQKVLERAKISIEAGEGNPDWLIIVRARIYKEKYLQG